MRPTRIVEGLNVPQNLDDIIDTSRLKLQSTDQQLMPAPYDPAAVRVRPPSAARVELGVDAFPCKASMSYYYFFFS
jgi:hypothetical protein